MKVELLLNVTRIWSRQPVKYTEQSTLMVYLHVITFFLLYMYIAIYIYNVTTKETFDCGLLFTEALCGCISAQSECSHNTSSLNKCQKVQTLATVHVRKVYKIVPLNSKVLIAIMSAWTGHLYGQ